MSNSSLASLIFIFLFPKWFSLFASQSCEELRKSALYALPSTWSWTSRRHAHDRIDWMMSFRPCGILSRSLKKWKVEERQTFPCAYWRMNDSRNSWNRLRNRYEQHTDFVWRKIFSYFFFFYKFVKRFLQNLTLDYLYYVIQICKHDLLVNIKVFKPRIWNVIWLVPPKHLNIALPAIHIQSFIGIFCPLALADLQSSHSW